MHGWDAARGHRGLKLVGNLDANRIEAATAQGIDQPAAPAPPVDDPGSRRQPLLEDPQDRTVTSLQSWRWGQPGRNRAQQLQS